MTPRPPIPPSLPPKVARSMQNQVIAPAKTGNPLLRRYLSLRGNKGLLKALVLYYAVLIALSGIVLPFVSLDDSPKIEFLIRLIGTFCFLISTIVIPLVSSMIFPPPDETDPAFALVPIDRLTLFCARLIPTLILSAITAFPLLPILMIADIAHGNRTMFASIFPAFQAVATSAWVFFIMELSEGNESHPGRYSRRLSIVAAFVLLHIGLVGFVSRASFATLQNFQILKLLTDLNPFSQLYILMEGPAQQRLLFNTAMQRLIDFRIYMFMIQTFFLIIALLLHRFFLTGSFRTASAIERAG